MNSEELCKKELPQQILDLASVVQGIIEDSHNVSYGSQISESMRYGEWSEFHIVRQWSFVGRTTG